MMRDASSLSSIFAPAIFCNTPHIYMYLSMIPVSMDWSKVSESRHYAKKLTSFVRVGMRGKKPLTALLKVFKAHKDIDFA